MTQLFDFEAFSNAALFASCLFIMLGSIYLSFKTRFAQLRMFPILYRNFFHPASHNVHNEGEHTIAPHTALLTAMSTTIGIGTIVGPVLAIRLGGPGALLGFLLTAFFGCATTYVEVGLAIKFRKKMENGEILGGPMQYLRVLISPKAATWYAIFGSLLMAAWSAAQANQVVALLNSPQLGVYRVPTFLSGGILALLALFVLFGGIKRLGSLSEKLIPVMFVLYLASALWILAANIDRFGAICQDILFSAFSPRAMASGGLVGGFVSAMRWGIFKGTQGTEAGVGTQTIPHSMAETRDPEKQAMLAMVSTYTAGAVAFLSGFVILATETWQDPALPLGISMMAASFQQYFSHFGLLIIAIITILFGFGTIIGNSYNGSQCFGYLTNNRYLKYYYVCMAFAVFLGSVFDAKAVWSHTDIGLACLIVPHMLALIFYSSKRQESVSLESSTGERVC